MLFMPTVAVVNSALDLTTVTFISALIILSVLSLCFIFHLRLKSRSLKHLQGFNSLWAVRFLLVLFIFLWSISELLRLPFFRRRYLYPFLPSALPVSLQSSLCKAHVLLSLGLFQPAYLVTLLFLLNASIAATSPTAATTKTTIASVLLTCLPIATIQGLLTFFGPLSDRLPGLFRDTSVVLSDGFGSETVLCSYPLLNSIVFAGFGFAYCAWFLFSCWKVLSLVINKGLRLRIYGLAAAILVALPVQVVALGLTVLWRPDEQVNGVVSLVVFLAAFCCAAAGEGVMVIKPISDALDAGVSCTRWMPRDGEDSGKDSTTALRPGRVAGGEDSV